jgi:hypothetical protein
MHLIISAKLQTEGISALIRDIKKHTSREIVNAIRTINESRRDWLLSAMKAEAGRIGRATHYKLWRDDNHAMSLDGHGIMTEQKLLYIHENPVRNGLVENGWEYLYSSARDYECNRKGLVNIEMI